MSRKGRGLFILHPFGNLARKPGMTSFGTDREKSWEERRHLLAFCGRRASNVWPVAGRSFRGASDQTTQRPGNTFRRADFLLFLASGLLNSFHRADGVYGSEQGVHVEISGIQYPFQISHFILNRGSRAEITVARGS